MTRIQIRRDTSERFNTINPILAEGEPAYETDTKKRKIGDGSTQYSDLPYLDSGGGGTEYTLPVATADTLGGIKQGTGCTIEEDGTLNITATGGEGGTTDYNELTNKPSINNVPLEGNLTTEQLGIDIPDVSNLVTDEELTSATQDLVTNSSLQSTLTDYAKTSELPDISNLVTNTDLTSTLEGYAKTSDIPDLSPYITFDGNSTYFYDDFITLYNSNKQLRVKGEIMAVHTSDPIRFVDISYNKISISNTRGKTVELSHSGTDHGLAVVSQDTLIADIRTDAIEFTAPVKVGVKGNPQNLYVQSEQQISRATEAGGLFYTVESKFNGTKIESMTQDAYNALEAPDENTIYLIEEE